MCHMGTVETRKNVKILRTIKHFDFEQNIFISDAVSENTNCLVDVSLPRILHFVNKNETDHSISLINTWYVTFNFLILSRLSIDLFTSY